MSLSSDWFTVEEQGKVMHVIFHMPDSPVNLLSPTFFDHFSPILEHCEKNPPEFFIFSSNKQSQFIAGADINILAGLKTADEAKAICQQGQDLFLRLERLPCLSAVLVDGPCMGGGLELALCFDVIVISDNPKSKVALPEVKLGILPGLGGTQRLKERVRLDQALPILLQGKTSDASKAWKLGIADAVCPAHLMKDTALKYLRGQAQKRKRPWLHKVPLLPQFILKKARQQVLKASGGHYPSPLKIIDVLQKTMTASREKGQTIERDGFADLAVSDACRHLMGLYLMTENTKKAPDDPDRPLGHPTKRGAVIGAGVMGGAIARLMAEKNIQTSLKDINHEALALGMKTAASFLNKRVKRRRIRSYERMAILDRINPTLNMDACRQADAVIEAVVEKLEVKQHIFQELAQICPQHTVLMSNTSSLPIADIAKDNPAADRIVGLHFFNPVDRMPLVEIIPSEQTSAESIATARQLAIDLGKIPVVVGDRPGFLVNRLLGTYLNEAIYALEEGADPQSIEDHLLAYGMPMGPLRLLDEVGIDIGWHVSEVLAKGLGDRLSPPQTIIDMAQAGKLGKKKGLGFYKHEGKNSQLTYVNPKANSKAPSGARVRDRCLALMIAEAARCLDEGVAATPEDLDLAMIMGTGFPPFRGGLLKAADEQGLQYWVETLQRESQEKAGTVHEKRYQVPDFLQQMGKTGGFYKI